MAQNPVARQIPPTQVPEVEEEGTPNTEIDSLSRVAAAAAAAAERAAERTLEQGSTSIERLNRSLWNEGVSSAASVPGGSPPRARSFPSLSLFSRLVLHALAASADLAIVFLDERFCCQGLQNAEQRETHLFHLSRR
jgi:hypothetical protein